jgi:hypothetical protein
MTQISKNFTLEEFQISQEAARQGRPIFVPADLLPDLYRLVDDILQPFREFLGLPIHTLSGYRPPWLNAAIGGSKTSQHMKAQACDFTVIGMTPAQVCHKVLQSGVPFDQLIHEFGQWTHISVAPRGETPRRSILTAIKENGITIYRAGLPPQE